MTSFSVEPLLYLIGVLLFVMSLGGLLMFYAIWCSERRPGAGESKALGSSPAAPLNGANPDVSGEGERAQSNKTS